jgi:GMP synthase-like glutamine amidotransferase
MRILTIMSNPITPAGRIGDRIERRGGACIEINPHEGDDLPPDSSAFDGVIILGGPMSVADPDYAHVFDPMAALVRDFHDEEKPVMGVCLGAQLIAKAFDKSVFPTPQFEFGFKRLEITDEGREDPLLEGLRPEQRVFVHHTDTFELPDGAVLLMAGESTRNYGFRIGRSTYGFQSHLEADEDLIHGWLSRRPPRVVQHLGERGWALIATVDEQIARYDAIALNFANVIGDRWAEMVEERRRRKTAAAG